MHFAHTHAVNRGIDEAVRGLERLKRTKDSGLDSAYFDERLVLFEDHRARLNAYFCNNLQSREHRDSAHFAKRHREYENDVLDEVQGYRDVQAIEQRRRLDGKAPKVRFFTHADQREWELQYPKLPGDAEGDAHGSKGEQT